MFVALLSSAFAFGGSVPTDAGTIEVGGNAFVNTNLAPDFYLGVQISPRAGYFVADRLEILLQPTLGVDGIGLDGTISTIGLGAGAHYFLGSEDMPFYVGGEVGFVRTSGNIAGLTVTGDNVFLAVPGGILFPVSDNVALDLGARLLVQAPDGGDLFISLPAGFIGVRGFIP